MRRVLSLVLLRTLILVALAASAALLYDYTRPLAAFCETGAGCETVRNSAFAHIGPVPQPVLGIVAFALLFAITLLPEQHRKRWVLPVAALGGLMGLGFLVIQAVWLRAFCYLCVITDGAAILAAVAALVYARTSGPSEDGLARWLWALSAVAATALPYVFGTMQPQPPVPLGVARLWVPGKLNIVELSDFECPFCRRLHFDLLAATKPHADQVNLVRLSVPLRMHPNARPASQAYICAREQSLGEPMAHALFEAEALSPQAIEHAAQSLVPLKLDLQAWQSCMRDPATDKKVDAESERAKEIGFRGLPTLWIGEQTITGWRPEEELRKVIDKELAGGAAKPPQVPEALLWVVLFGSFAALATVAVLRSPARRQTPS